MHQQLWGYKVEWKSVSRGTGGKKVEYHCSSVFSLSTFLHNNRNEHEISLVTTLLTVSLFIYLFIYLRALRQPQVLCKEGSEWCMGRRSDRGLFQGIRMG
jgi:hypothetical protein